MSLLLKSRVYRDVCILLANIGSNYQVVVVAVGGGGGVLPGGHFEWSPLSPLFKRASTLRTRYGVFCYRGGIILFGLSF